MGRNRGTRTRAEIVAQVALIRERMPTDAADDNRDELRGAEHALRWVLSDGVSPPSEIFTSEKENKGVR